MNLWKFLFGDDTSRRRPLNKSRYPKKDNTNSSSGNSVQKRKLSINKDSSRIKFEKKEDTSLDKKAQSTLEKKQGTRSENIKQQEITEQKEQQDKKFNSASASIIQGEHNNKAITEIRPEMDKLLLETVKIIEGGIFTTLSDVMIYDKKENKIVAHYTHDELDLSRLHDVMGKFFKLIEGGSGLEVKNFAIFHFGHYRLGLMFNPLYAVFILMDAVKINEGLALAYIRPRIIQLLQKISMNSKQ